MEKEKYSYDSATAKINICESMASKLSTENGFKILKFEQISNIEISD